MMRSRSHVLLFISSERPGGPAAPLSSAGVAAQALRAGTALIPCVCSLALRTTHFTPSALLLFPEEVDLPQPVPFKKSVSLGDDPVMTSFRHGRLTSAVDAAFKEPDDGR
jgi:hypothetical protein